jgi:hypothetical protein
MNPTSSCLRSSLAVLASLLAFPASVWGADPDLPFQTVAYQGRLKVGDGALHPTARFDLRFHLYDAATGGSPLDEAVVQSVAVDSNGLFTVLIDAHPLWSSVSVAHWVELDTRPSDTASNYVTLLPRQRITAVPEALRAQTAVMAMSYTGTVSSAQLPANVARLDIPQAFTAAPQFVITSGPPFHVSQVVTMTVANLSADLLDGLDATQFWRRSVDEIRETLGPTDGSHVFEVMLGTNRAVRLQPVAGAAPAFALGPRAIADYSGSFVWADGQSADFRAQAANQFAVRAAGGARYETGGAGLTVDGTRLTGTGGALLIPDASVTSASLQNNAVISPKIADGQVVRSLNGLKDNVLLSASDGLLLTPVGNELRLAALRSCGDYTNCYWCLFGNGNVTAGVNFLGTVAGELDPLEVRVNNNRALHILPAATPNLVGGFSGNAVATGITGAHIGGGGEPGSVNVVSANYGTVGGGSGQGIHLSASYATIGGGNKNTVSTNSSYATVSGGDNNIIRTDSRYATIGGGQLNTIEPKAVFATISGGSQHSLGTNSVDGTIAGGSNNTIARDTQGATIGGGNLHSIQTGASSATIGGGYQNAILPTAPHGTVPGGRQGRALNYGQMAYASGAFASPGDAQFSLYVLRRTLTAAVTNELFLDGDAATQRLRIPVEGTWTFDILVCARTDAGASAGYRVSGVIRNNAGATALVGTPVKTVLGEDMATWDVFVEADNANDALAVKAYGVGTPVVPTRWVATVRTTEVIF